ncbi:MAG: hypothetical protein WCQ32_00165 [bacterium]
MKYFFGKKTILTIFLGCVLFLPISQTYAQSFQGSNINVTGMTGALLNCQVAGGKSSDDWITQGVGSVTAFANKEVSKASSALFGGVTNQYIAGAGVVIPVAHGGLFCGTSCKNRLQADAFKKASNEKDASVKSTGSSIQQPVIVSETNIVDAINSNGKAAVDIAKTTAANQDKRETCTDALAKYTLRKSLAKMSSIVLGYINTGMAGSPFYVTDQSSYFQNMYHSILYKYLKPANLTVSSNDPTLNNAVNQQVNNLITSEITGKTPHFLSNLSNTQFGKTYNKDANNIMTGGWTGWLNSTYNQGNAMGQYLSTIDYINRDYSNQKNNAQNELNQGHGYFSQKVCAKYSNQTDENGEKVCTQFRVVTPGDAIANQANAITTTQIHQLETANKISDVIAGIVDAKLNDWLNKGLAHYGEGSQDYPYNPPTTPNKWSPSPFSNSLPLATDGVDTATAEISYANGADVGANFDISHTTQLAAILKTQYDYINKASDSINANKKMVANLGALDYCLPGPNPSWSVYAGDSNDNFNKALSSGSGYQGPGPAPNYTNESFATDRYGFQDPVTNSVIPYRNQVFNIYPIHPPYTYQVQEPNNEGFLDIACNIGSSLLNSGALTSAVGSLAGGYIGGSTGSSVGGILGSAGQFNTSCSHTVTKTEASPTPGSDVADAFEQWFSSYTNEINTRYGLDTLMDQYVLTDPNKNNSPEFVRGQVRDMYNESFNLIEYNNQLQANADAYGTEIDKAESTAAQMQDIYNQVLAIVKVARARHIATQAAQGITVNQSCLDQNYAINLSTAGAPAQESDANSDSTVIQSQFAQYDFYQNLCNTAGGIANATCTPPTVKPVSKIGFIAKSNAVSCLMGPNLLAKSVQPTTSITLTPIKTVAAGNYHVHVDRQVYADYYRADQAAELAPYGGFPLAVYKDPQIKLEGSNVAAKASRPRYGDALYISGQTIDTIFQSNIYLMNAIVNPGSAAALSMLHVSGITNYIDMPWLPDASSSNTFTSGGDITNVSGTTICAGPSDPNYDPNCAPRACMTSFSWGTDPSTQDTAYLNNDPSCNPSCNPNVDPSGSCGTQVMSAGGLTWLSYLTDGWNFNYPDTTIDIDSGGKDPNIIGLYDKDVTTIPTITDTSLTSLFETYRKCDEYSQDSGRGNNSKTHIGETDNVCTHSIEEYIPKNVRYVITISDNNDIDTTTGKPRRISINTVSVPFEGFYTKDINPSKSSLLGTTFSPPHDSSVYQFPDPGPYAQIQAGTLLRNYGGGSTIAETLDPNLKYRSLQTSSVALCAD